MAARNEIEVFERTAEECALDDEDLVYEYSKRFPLWNMNSRDRQRMVDAIIAEQGITGGWYWFYCLPGCLPIMEPIGPFGSYKEALADAEEDADTYYPED